ncbi:hypothetical protein DMB66_57770 [Actinoplanes sp. ATCC 53533]|uniref:hypothetical protein n=1 Tax=Actinoplanes sp. ATCC 53533 TaxID=1288362 RepID=UPI000F779865|nr:hypothetical protein [Actinoplanes sp. ATCC 53533]RSM39903.1 hypothetical protein DMB66_57770 [Actinoplanes sp. ATCC 53533]
MLTDAVLADVSDVLDQTLRAAVTGPGALDARVINDVALVHRIRAMGLGHPVEELHACGALQVLGYVIDPSAAAPQTRQEIADAIGRGAATDFGTALLPAMQGHASAVRAAWRRAPSRGLADTFVHAFRRLVDLAGPDVPNFPTRLLDLAAALDARYGFDEPQGVLEDLNTAIGLAQQAISVAPDDRDVVRRAHLLLGPMLVTRDEVNPGFEDITAALGSYRTVVELTDTDDLQYEARLLNLRRAQQLADNP